MDKAEIIEFPAVFTEEKCQSIITEARPRLTQAMVGRGIARGLHPARVADNFKYKDDVPWTRTLREYVAGLTDTDDLSKVEPVEVMRFPVGGCHYRHNDSTIGDRSHTFLISINDDYEGGEVYFDQLGALYEHIPSGLGLLWACNRFTTKEVRPVTYGEAWFVCVWVHTMTEEERKRSGQDPLGPPDDEDNYKDSPIIIPGVND